MDGGRIGRLANLFNSVTVKVKSAPQVRLHPGTFGIRRFYVVDRTHYVLCDAIPVYKLCNRACNARQIFIYSVEYLFGLIERYIARTTVCSSHSSLEFH